MPNDFDIKICGLSTPEAVDAAIYAGATMVGFVFVEGSPRHLTPETAAPLAELAKGQVKTVGLFADTSIDDIHAIRRDVHLDHIQIHGREDAATRAALTAAFPDVLMAKPIAVPADLPSADEPAPYRWLFDARAPRKAGPQGGHGVPFDWGLLDQYQGAVPFLLAGGLGPDNVADAIERLAKHPQFAGVDVSTGVETAPGQKDPARIEAFVSAARAARAAFLH